MLISWTCDKWNVDDLHINKMTECKIYNDRADIYLEPFCLGFRIKRFIVTNHIGRQANYKRDIDFNK
jgi:hypothetical protein